MTSISDHINRILREIRRRRRGLIARERHIVDPQQLLSGVNRHDLFQRPVAPPANASIT